MLQSMTGFASLERCRGGLQLMLRLRSVNSRFLDLRLRLPGSLAEFEPIVREELRVKLIRGKIELDLDLRPAGSRVGASQTHWRADLAAARQIRDALDEIRVDLALPGRVDLGQLVRAGGVHLLQQGSLEPPAGCDLEGLLRDTVRDGVDMLREIRRAEGGKLLIDLDRGIGVLHRLLEDVIAARDDLAHHARERLPQKLRELGLQPRGEEESRRFAQEAVLIAERMDVNEEIVRLGAHIESFEETCLQAEDPCGKRLGFLLQEMLREVNTLGSKLPGAELRARVVDMKVEIEKLREQVANIA